MQTGAKGFVITMLGLAVAKLGSASWDWLAMVDDTVHRASNHEEVIKALPERFEKLDERLDVIQGGVEYIRG